MSTKRPPEELPELEARTYKIQRILGKGAFGSVYLAQIEETGKIVAVKCIKTMEVGNGKWSFTSDDSCREVQILKELGDHPNICQLIGAYVTDRDDQKKMKLNLVFEYVSDTLSRIIRHYNVMQPAGPRMQDNHVRIYSYCLLRGLAFMHGKGFMHCDIKPPNLLVDGKTHILKICDFGTTKRAGYGQKRAPYVMSRYYRAPEIILGSTVYSTSVDLWSAGAVMAEMILGQPLFCGLDGVDQLENIVKVLGTPTGVQLRAMNPSFPPYTFNPVVEPLSWDVVLRNWASGECVELIGWLVRYEPSARIAPLAALQHSFFDRLRTTEKQDFRILFDFTEDELLWCTEDQVEKLIPPWARSTPPS